MRADSFPYLETLLGGYFHQDCYDFGETDEDIIRAFNKSSWEYQRLGARADIKRLLHEHPDDLLTAVQEIFQPSVTVGETDPEAREWLMKIEALIALENREPSEPTILREEPPAP